jgi:hypothetical protein
MESRGHHKSMLDLNFTINTFLLPINIHKESGHNIETSDDELGLIEFCSN